ncbi:uncharacterized protein LOC111211218 [Brassica napus]|uniref:uncharacterized protein LOC111211218 n=1 Tax=Brassica napus TaxID=3708 RepID=UPI000BBF397E|nr:uncharacterized protein LOC111211218 [Brassica napus]
MDIAGWVGNCLTCQLVKEEHQVPSRLFQSLSMPEWKWDMITMDFVCGLLKTKSYKDSVWVIVDRLTKLAHFLPFQMSDGVDKCVELYMRVIVKLHGAHEYNISSTNGMTIGEDNPIIGGFIGGLRSGLGRLCRTLLCWIEVGDGRDLYPGVIKEMTDTIKFIKEKMKEAQDRQKSYVDKSRKELEFQVGEMVYLKRVKSKGNDRTAKMGKLQPRYMGPFMIVERVGPVTYRLEMLDVP